MKTIYKYITLLILLSFSVSANVDETDKTYKNAIVGTWAHVFKKDTMMWKGFTTYQKSGVFNGDVIFAVTGKKEIVSISGTWEVKDGLLITKITTSTHPQIIGEVSTYKIINISETTYEYKSSDGEVSKQTKCIIKS